MASPRALGPALAEGQANACRALGFRGRSWNAGAAPPGVRCHGGCPQDTRAQAGTAKEHETEPGPVPTRGRSATHGPTPALAGAEAPCTLGPRRALPQLRPPTAGGLALLTCPSRGRSWLVWTLPHISSYRLTDPEARTGGKGAVSTKHWAPPFTAPPSQRSAYPGTAVLLKDQRVQAQH